MIQEMTATSILSLFETTKEQRKTFAENVIETIREGQADPLKVHLQVKMIEETLKQLKDSPEYKDAVLTEAGKYGKSFEFHNAKVEIKEMGTKYYYDPCNDPVLFGLQVRQQELEKEIKERETMLKTISPKGMEILIDDELVTIYPPSKSSTTSVAITLK